MRMDMAYGRQHVEVEVQEHNVLAVQRYAPVGPVLSDPAAAVRLALEQPQNFPALKHALTPDDHVAVVVDERVPQLARLLAPILDHLTQAHVAPESITLLSPPNPGSQAWIDDLPDAFQDVRVEVHNPADRRGL